MKTELRDYDIYPKVVPAGEPVEITIRALGAHVAFGTAPVAVRIRPLQGRGYPAGGREMAETAYEVCPGADGALRFTHAFEGEQEHYLRIDAPHKVQLSVYSLEKDLVGLIPLLGDQHVHTCRSDGREAPPVVAANLRREGYDYAAITDHCNFSGSLEAIEAYQGVPIGICLMTGEEVHLPSCPIHVVSIGAQYSVNALIAEMAATVEEKRPGILARGPYAWRAVAGCAYPPSMTSGEFRAAVEEYARTLPPIPEDVPRFVYAGFAWICDQIRRAGGLSIFAHPYWIYDVFHVDERFTEYIFQQRRFDVFEVLGGERYYAQNGLQTLHYYDARSRGYDFPIVGSSDSHGTVNNPNAFIASTIAFARANRPAEILEAIRDKRTVAVDGISAEYRLVGDYRLGKYACFLMENYFPLHKEACFEQGRAMLEYHCGDREVGQRLLEALDGRVERMWRKYFAGVCQD